MNIGLKYERLPHFCFLCGLMSHTDRGCRQDTEKEKDNGNKWGLDIKASPRKGLSKSKEVEALKGRGGRLFTPKPDLHTKTVMPRSSGDGGGLIRSLSSDGIIT